MSVIGSGVGWFIALAPLALATPLDAQYGQPKHAQLPTACQYEPYRWLATIPKEKRTIQQQEEFERFDALCINVMLGYLPDEDRPGFPRPQLMPAAFEPPSAPTHAQLESRLVPDREPARALFWSLLMPGGGQFYKRQPGKGVMFLLANVAGWAGLTYAVSDPDDSHDALAGLSLTAIAGSFWGSLYDAVHGFPRTQTVPYAIPTSPIPVAGAARHETVESSSSPGSVEAPSPSPDPPLQVPLKANQVVSSPAAASPAPLIQGSMTTSEEARSKTSGFTLGLALNGAALQVEDQDEIESGAGITVRAGYGLTESTEIFTNFSGSNVEHANIDDTYGLGHLDLGLRYNFASPARAMRPFAQAAFGVRVASIEGDGDTLDIGGATGTIGLGLSYFLDRTVALETGFDFSFGDFSLARLNDGDWEELDESGFSGTSTRFMLGISLHP